MRLLGDDARDDPDGQVVLETILSFDQRAKNRGKPKRGSSGRGGISAGADPQI